MDIESKIGQQIVEKYEPDFIGKQNLRVFGRTFGRVKFFEKYCQKIISEIKGEAEFYPKYRTEEAQKDIFLEILSEIERQKKEAARRHFDGNLPESLPKASYALVVDVKRPDTRLINLETNELSELHPESYMATLDKDERLNFKSRTRLAQFEYDPYDLSNLNEIEFDGYKVMRVNLYRPPTWRLRPNIDSECPEQIEKVLKHLLPQEKYRNFVLDWLYHALVERNETYLVLNGPKGIGKGLFSKIARALVGKDHYTEAPESFLDSHFNSALDNKRIIVLDEIRVDKNKHTKLKRYANKFQNIEKKGVDADKVRETFNSYIISNNDETDMYVEYDDRRFAVMDLASGSLLEAMTKEEITALDKELDKEDSDIVHQFGYWLFNRGAKQYDPFSVIKGEKFYSLVYTSLRQWQKFLVEELLDGPKKMPLKKLTNIAQVQEQAINFPQNTQKIQDFLNNYLHEGKDRLGSLVKEGKEWMLIKNSGDTADLL